MSATLQHVSILVAVACVGAVIGTLTWALQQDAADATSQSAASALRAYDHARIDAASECAKYALDVRAGRTRDVPSVTAACVTYAESLRRSEPEPAEPAAPAPKSDGVTL